MDIALPRAARRLLPRTRQRARTRRRLAARHLQGVGIEIGALHEPLRLPKRASVTYVDRLGLPGLRAHYPELGDESLVEPDVVDDGERLLRFSDSTLDFVIANHFIEHCENPIGTLSAFARVLRPGGVVFMAVPDRQQGVDRDRPGTPFWHLRRDHDEGPGWSRLTHYREWARDVDARMGTIALDQMEQHAAHMDEQSYSIHFHAWSPVEFAQMVRAAGVAYGLSLDLLSLVPNQHEFIAVLRSTS